MSYSNQGTYLELLIYSRQSSRLKEIEACFGSSDDDDDVAAAAAAGSVRLNNCNNNSTNGGLLEGFANKTICNVSQQIVAF